ncbi:hypothetical protein CMV_021946 [Castanea mollissima]|uniref:Uncharacterized protein n=1 Tax=Castanea mollissima TaxID=60419 RepID=A0A8J4V8K7_9ROSI|nr:hypothetical protein CMV_021946 [Castanea mollissima]
MGRSKRGGSVVAGRGEIGEWRKRSAMEEENGEWRKMGDRRCGFVVAGLGGSVMGELGRVMFLCSVSCLPPSLLFNGVFGRTGSGFFA